MPTMNVNAQDLHFEHTLWSKELAFAGDEIRFFEKKLGEIVSKISDREVLASLEHFQNQFIRQKEVVDELNHAIGVHEQDLGNRLKADAELDDNLAETHAKVRDDMMMFRKLFAELKTEFFQFLGKVF